MAEIKWYKRDPDAALTGMMQLTLEERGAYNTVLDLIYSRANRLEDDDYMIAGFCRVDVRIWRRIRAKLIKEEKLYIEDGFVRNERADSEVIKASKLIENASAAGKASAEKRRRSRGDAVQHTPLSTAASVMDAPQQPADGQAGKCDVAQNENNGIATSGVSTDTQRACQQSTTTTTSTSRAKQSPLDWDILESRLREAAGWQSEPHPNLRVVGQIAALIDSGADLERDVLPIVKAKAPLVRKRTSWNFFIDPIKEARDKRLAISVPQPQSAQAPIWENWTDRQYEAAITAVKRSGRWPETFGPIERIPERLIDDEIRRIIGRRP